MDNLEKMVELLIDKQGISFISSVDENGYPNTKAMLAPCKKEGIKCFYWHTNLPSIKIKEYRANKKACVYFYDKESYSGITLKGFMEVYTEEKSKVEFWKDSYKKYYPNNDFVIIKFTAESGRYYHNLQTHNFDIKS